MKWGVWKQLDWNSIPGNVSQEITELFDQTFSAPWKGMICVDTFYISNIFGLGWFVLTLFGDRLVRTRFDSTFKLSLEMEPTFAILKKWFGIKGCIFSKKSFFSLLGFLFWLRDMKYYLVVLKWCRLLGHFVSQHLLQK